MKTIWRDIFTSLLPLAIIIICLIVSTAVAVSAHAQTQTIPRTVTVIHKGIAREVTHEAARAKLMELLRTRRNPELLSALIRALGANTFCYDTPVCESHDGPCACNRVEKR